MVQYYTLEEVAKLLHTTPDKIKEMAKNGEVRPFQDRGNLRFRAQEINELARVKGFGSDPELVLGDVIPLAEGPPAKSGSKSPSPAKVSPPEDAGAVFDFTLSTDESGVVPLGNEPPSSGKAGPSSSSMRKKTPNPRPSTHKSPPPIASSDSDVRLVADGSDLDFKIADEPHRSPPPAKKGSSGGKSKLSPPPRRDSEILLGPGPKANDSDVKLVGEAASSVGQSKKPSDSDIRLDHGDLPAPPSSKRIRREVITEEIDLDAEFQKAEEAARAKGAPAPTVKPGKGPQLPTSSPYDEAKAKPPRTPGPKTPARVAPPKSVPPKPVPPKSGPRSPSRLVPPSKPQGVESSDEFTLAPMPKDDSSGEVSPLEPASGDSSPVLRGDEEVSLGELSGSAGGSGINLQLPADSGISLEQQGSDEIEFELSLDPSDESKSLISKGERSGKTGLKKEQPSEEDEGPSDFELSLKEDSDPGAGSGSDSEFELTLDGEESVDASPIVPASESGSESEFELTLDDSGSGKMAVEHEAGGVAGEEKDIFETDFEVPSLEEDESGSGSMALESDTDVETSDFDLSASESGEAPSGSQVVELEDEAAAESGAATIKRPSRRGKAAIADEAEIETDAEELLEQEEDEETLQTAAAAAAPPAEWGPLPVIGLVPCVLILFVVGLMGFELVESMWGYHRGAKVPGLIINMLAGDSLPKSE